MTQTIAKETQRRPRYTEELEEKVISKFELVDWRTGYMIELRNEIHVKDSGNEHLNTSEK